MMKQEDNKSNRNTLRLRWEAINIQKEKSQEGETRREKSFINFYCEMLFVKLHNDAVQQYHLHRCYTECVLRWNCNDRDGNKSENRNVVARNITSALVIVGHCSLAFFSYYSSAIVNMKIMDNKRQ